MLQLFFFCAKVYGWFAWTRPQQQTGELLKVRWLSKSKLIATTTIAVVFIALLTPSLDETLALLANSAIGLLNLFGAGLEMPILEPGAHPFWDASVTGILPINQLQV